MELKKHYNPRVMFLSIYALMFVVYIIIGLQPAEASHYYEVSGRLDIPSIQLDSDVTALELQEHSLDTPDTIVGSYSQSQNKTLLIGHSTTVFRDLDKVKIGDDVLYNELAYRVNSIEVAQKSEINMTRLLSDSDIDTLVIMTCAGTLLNDGDATHRLIITATR